MLLTIAGKETYQVPFAKTMQQMKKLEEELENKGQRIYSKTARAWHCNMTIIMKLPILLCAGNQNTSLVYRTKTKNYKQLSYGRETARRMHDYKGVGHIEAKFYVEGLRFAPISMDRWMGNGYTTTLLLQIFLHK